jgi:phosphohistidine phosphatase
VRDGYLREIAEDIYAATPVGKRLILLRHAKSDYPENVPDHDRPLAKRGRHDAPLVGGWLRESGYIPDVVVCSTAARAVQTWERAASSLGASPPVRYERRVYLASVLALLMLVREFAAEAGTVAVVGHNPGIAELAAGLAGQEGHAALRFPTAAVAVLDLPSPWASVEPGEATLLAFATPATMREAD